VSAPEQEQREALGVQPRRPSPHGGVRVPPGGGGERLAVLLLRVTAGELPADRTLPGWLIFFCVCFVLITRSRSLRIGNGLLVSCGRSSASWEEFPVRGFWLSELCGLICSEGLMLKESFNAGK